MLRTLVCSCILVKKAMHKVKLQKESRQSPKQPGRWAPSSKRHSSNTHRMNTESLWKSKPSLLTRRVGGHRPYHVRSPTHPPPKKINKETGRMFTMTMCEREGGEQKEGRWSCARWRMARHKVVLRIHKRGYVTCVLAPSHRTIQRSTPPRWSPNHQAEAKSHISNRKGCVAAKYSENVTLDRLIISMYRHTIQQQ